MRKEIIYITRRERFNAAHRLFNPDWSDEKNLKIFGKCSNPNWHGHNYEIFITIRGEVGQKTGYVMNLKELSKIIVEHIINKIDHKNINLEVDFMKGKIASTENLVVSIWETLLPFIREKGMELYKIRLVETENNFVEYFGK